MERRLHQNNGSLLRDSPKHVEIELDDITKDSEADNKNNSNIKLLKYIKLSEASKTSVETNEMQTEITDAADSSIVSFVIRENEEITDKSGETSNKNEDMSDASNTSIRYVKLDENKSEDLVIDIPAVVDSIPHESELSSSSPSSCHCDDLIVPLPGDVESNEDTEISKASCSQAKQDNEPSVLDDEKDADVGQVNVAFEKEEISHSS